MIALRRLPHLLAWLAGELAAVVALTRLGAHRPFTVSLGDLRPWLAHAEPADAVMVVLRWVALLGAWWLLMGTTLYLLVALTRVPTAIRAVRWAALPSVRRAIDAAFACSVVAGAVLAPSGAGAVTGTVPPATSVRDGHARGLDSRPAETRRSAPPPAPPPTTPTPPVAVVPPNVVVTVAPGDNLWELAAQHLAIATSRARGEVGDAEVARYWVAVCERNRATLASGDPNLVFPGELIAFPPIS